MLIVTVASDGERAGCLVGFASQISVHPGQFLACISIKNHTHGRASRAQSIGVRVVRDSQPSLAELFGGETATRWTSPPDADGNRLPMARRCWMDAPDRFVGSVITRLDLGDHSGFVLDPWLAEYTGERRQLSMQRALQIDPGTTPSRSAGCGPAGAMAVYGALVFEQPWPGISRG